MKLTTALLIVTIQVAECTLDNILERDVGAQVNTSSGIVAGHAASNATTVSEYLGIPFAQPPVGQLRFQPPEKFQADPNLIINGTDFGFACLNSAALQTTTNTVGANLTAAGVVDIERDSQVGDKFGEDCLTLNVWVPSGGDESKAVLLWVYGGAFLNGGSSIPTYNGQYIADQEGVIVVTINYRLNIFGFPASPSLQNGLNLGLLDQRLAFEWVHDNIQAFGGDPTRITAFAQSAGAESLDLHSYAYPTNPILSGLILESGTTSLLPPIADNSASWFSTASKVGCPGTSANSSDVMSCMQTADPLAIVKNMGQTWGPTIDNITVFADYPARNAAGNFSQIPLLIGNNNDEASLFAVQAELQGGGASLTTAQLQTANLNEFTCPSGARANASVSRNVPTWRYRWFGEFPNTELTTVPDSGAWHGSEMAVIFDTLPTGDGIPDSTTAENAIAAYIRGAWAAFAKNATGGLDTYDNGAWPRYNPTAATLIRLAYQNETTTDLVNPSTYDANCTKVFVIPGTSASSTSSQVPTSSPTATGTGTGGTPSQSSKPSAASGLFRGAGNSAMLAIVAALISSIMYNYI